MDPTSRQRALRLVAVVVLALGLRVAALGRDDLWSDEVHTLHAIERPTKALVAERLEAGHVPLYFLLLKGWTALAGTSPFSLRLPSAILGALLILPAGALFRRLAGREAAWTGMVLLALHPMLVELSREARMYSLLLLLFFVAAESALAAVERGRVPPELWIAVLVGSTVHPTWGMGLVAIAAFLLLGRAETEDGRRARKTVFVALAIGAAVLAAGLILATPQGQTLTRRPWPREIGVFALRLVAGAFLREPLLPFYAVLAAVWSMVLVLGWRAAGPGSRRFAVVCGIAPPALCALSALLLGTVIGPVRYVQVVVVGLVLLAAIGLRRHALAVALALLMLAGLGLRFVPAQTTWSDAARELRREGATCVVVPDGASHVVLSHYLDVPIHVGSPPEGTTEWWTAERGEDGGARLERQRGAGSQSQSGR